MDFTYFPSLGLVNSLVHLLHLHSQRGVWTLGPRSWRLSTVIKEGMLLREVSNHCCVGQTTAEFHPRHSSQIASVLIPKSLKTKHFYCFCHHTAQSFHPFWPLLMTIKATHCLLGVRRSHTNIPGNWSATSPNPLLRTAGAAAHTVVWKARSPWQVSRTSCVGGLMVFP